jgi:hypothetical protein
MIRVTAAYLSLVWATVSKSDLAFVGELHLPVSQRVNLCPHQRCHNNSTRHWVQGSTSIATLTTSELEQSATVAAQGSCHDWYQEAPIIKSLECGENKNGKIPKVYDTENPNSLPCHHHCQKLLKLRPLRLTQSSLILITAEEASWWLCCWTQNKN